MTNKQDRGELLFGLICDDVDQRLNPNNDECWHCGGEGETYDCIDGCCIDAESGCADCATACPECRLFKAKHAKAVREEVIKSGDTDIAIAWLKSIGRWRDGITPERVQSAMAAATAELQKASEGKST